MRDEALERGFARCEAAAFERAYERFGARMYACAMRIFNDRSLALDCVQDVMLRLWRKPGAYAPARGSLEAFLIVCTRNAALARVRDDARRRELLAEAPPPSTHAPDPDPFEHEHISRALRGLPEAHGEVIRLAYYQGMTHVEIASKLGEPVGTIKSRISSALRTLRTSLGKEVNQ